MAKGGKFSGLLTQHRDSGRSKAMKISCILCIGTLLLSANTLGASTPGGWRPGAACTTMIAPSASANARRIRFKPGQTTAQTTGRLVGWNDKAHFLIRLRAGQTMRLSVEGKCDDCHPDLSVAS